MSIFAVLRELVAATANLARAKARAKIDPCPPHDYGPNDRDFCVKCGEYRTKDGTA